MGSETETGVGVKVRLLGPLEVVLAGRVVDIGSAKQRAVLALLALQAGKVVTCDRLCDVLWGEEQPASPTANMQSLISRLRRALAGAAGGNGEVGRDVLPTREPGWALEVDPSAVDALRFEALTARARGRIARGEVAAAAVDLDEAISLWRAPALLDVVEAGYLTAEATRFNEARLDAVEDLADAELAMGRPADALARLELHVEANPYRERAWGELMIALYRLGRQTAALRTFERVRTILGEELGLDPSPALAEIQQRILNHDPALVGPSDVVRPSTEAESRPASPVGRSVLIGRDDDLVAVVNHLSRHAVTTLTGPGGVGKTALALAVARDQHQAFPGGVRPVWLGAIREPSLVAAEVAASVGLPRSGGRAYADALVSWLADMDVLVVLDNCEHVIEETGALVERLTAQLPGLRVLATSREPLSVMGEVVHRLAPLAVPTSDASAEAVASSPGVQLFLERARAQAPEFGDDAEHGQLVGDICRRLDGLPLAIEVAAARVSALHLDDIAASLDDLFRLLSRPGRGAEGRHRTLRSTVEWSYGLLEEPERVLLRRLSVFAGSFDLAAVHAVCIPEGHARAEVADLTARLVEKSLLVKGGAGHGYRMLETIRQFAAEQLADAGETEAFREAHARQYLELGQRVGAGLMSGGERAWLEQLKRAEDDLRVALGYLIDGDPTSGLMLAANLSMFWWTHGRHREGIRRLEAALAAAEDAPAELRAAGWFHLGFLLAHDTDDWSAAAELLDRGITAASSDGGRPLILGYLQCLRGECAVFAGDHRRGLERANDGLSIIREYPDPWGAGFGLWNVGFAHLAGGELDAAEACFEEMVATQRKHGIGLVLMIGCNSLGEIAERRGDLNRARALYEEALQLRKDLGAARLGYVHGSLAHSMVSIARVARAQGDERLGGMYLAEALPLAEEMRNHDLIQEIRALLDRRGAA